MGLAGGAEAGTVAGYLALRTPDLDAYRQAVTGLVTSFERSGASRGIARRHVNEGNNHAVDLVV